MRRRRLLPLFAIAVAVLVAPAVGGADATQSTASLRAQNARLAHESRSAALELYAIDSHLAAAHGQLAELTRQAAALRGQRATLARELRIARTDTTAAQAQLASQLRALYEQGNVEPLEVVLGAKDLDQALNDIANLNRVSGQSDEVLRQVEAARAQMRAAASRLAAEQNSLAAAAAQARAEETALAQARTERSAYVASLAARRQLNDRQIAAVVAEARAAQRRAQQLAQAPTAPAIAPTAADVAASAPAAPPAAAPAPAPAPVAGGRTLTVTATGYSLPGRTATGLPVGYGVVAVDPSVIPLGTHMTVPGYGDAVAADTGGAVVGATIDLWFPTLAQADAWGRRTVTIVLH